MQCIRLAFSNDSPEMIRLRRLLCNKSFMMEAAWDKQKLTVGATVPGYHGVDLGTILLNGGSGDRTPRVRFAAELMHGPRLKGFFLLRWVQEVLWERFSMGPGRSNDCRSATTTRSESMAHKRAATTHEKQK
jgi:hypothetical protein